MNTLKRLGGVWYANGKPFKSFRENLFLYILAYAGLILLQQLRLKLSLSVPGYAHVYLSETGSQRLGTMSIPAVICFLVLVVILAVPKLL